MANIIFDTIDTDKLVLDTGELCSRLMSECIDSTVYEYKEQIIKKIRPRYCYAKTSVLVNDNEVNLGFYKTCSKSLAQSLFGCKEAIVMAVTLGIEADMIINSSGVLSSSKGFVADAVFSALAESAADFVSSVIKREYSIRNRFSPGYGDLSLECQRPLLDYLSADKYLGIKLGSNYLMTPHKSITAFCGLERNDRCE